MKSSVVFTQVVERPARKLILKRGIKAADYFSYCEEVGCDVWGILESVKDALYEPVGLWLPESMRKNVTSEYCQGVEMPVDSDAALPEGFDLIDLPECKYMVFHGEPFEDEKFGEAIEIVWDAIKRYDPKLYGWEFYPNGGPRFQLDPIGKRGTLKHCLLGSIRFNIAGKRTELSCFLALDFDTVLRLIIILQTGLQLKKEVRACLR